MTEGVEVANCRVRALVIATVSIFALTISGCASDGRDPIEVAPVPKVTPLHNPENKAVSCNEDGCVIVEGNPGDREGGYPESEESKQMLADGRLTREEYERAFSNYVGCMAELGYTIQVRDTSSKYIDYSPADGEDEIFCYDTHYFRADWFWQIYEQPSESSAPGVQRFMDCLNDAGIKPLTEQIPEDWREQVYLFYDLEEQVAQAGEDGLLTHAQLIACYDA